jgi:hypothetical protein
MAWFRRLIFNRLGLLVALWLGGVTALHFTQIRHDRLPLDLAKAFPVGESPAPGAQLGTTLAALMNHELRSGTGWRPNDFFLWGPKLFADNNANRQLGVLQALRRTVQVMKEHLTKISSDPFDTNLDQADTVLRSDERRLWLPSAESRFRLGVHYLEEYVRGLKPELQTSKPLTLRHMELLRLFQAWSDLLGDAHANLYRSEIDGHAVRPWEDDDLFYHAQGYAHVIAACLRAIQREYAHSFEERGAVAPLVDEVARSLEQAAVLKPFVVLDGSDAGIFANHRRNLDAYIAEARQKIYSIREELEK